MKTDSTPNRLQMFRFGYNRLETDKKSKYLQQKIIKYVADFQAIVEMPDSTKEEIDGSGFCF